MHYNINYEVCALIFLIVVSIDFLGKRRLPTRTNKFFEAFILIGILDISLDLITAYTTEYSQNVPVCLNFILLTIFYMMQICLIAMLMLYTFALAEQFTKDNAPKLVVLMIPAAIFALLNLFNIFTGHIFTITETDFIHGPLFFLIYVTTLFYLVMVTIYTHRFRAKLRPIEVRTIYAFVFFILLTVGIQFFFPNCLLTGVGISIAITMMYLTLQNPDELLDLMTGSFNRGSLIVSLKEHLLYNNSCSVIVIAIDEMKAINNILGVDMGDAIIKKVFSIISQSAEKEMVFRMSGDKFAILPSSKIICRRIAKEIRETLCREHIVNNAEVRISACICYGTVTDVTDYEYIIKLLEYAIPVAKQSGKGTLLEIDDMMLKRYHRELDIQKALHEAIENDSLDVYFQPIYSAKEDKFTQAEALVRFPHPKLGMIYPNEFIPYAEKSGNIIKIGEQVLNKVCRLIREHDLINTTDIEHIEINLSAIEALQHSFPGKVRKILENHGVSAGHIIFEMTETAASNANNIVENTLRTLGDHGVVFALDDYGTGYANIDTVIRLPFSIIKLDKSMVWSYFQNDKNALIFRDTVKMMHDLGVQTLAEGVETQEQLDEMLRLGVDYIQGYYFARPMPTEDFLNFINNRG
ncbi:MAG: bifunctional diguanylate cyclase/phosphodiesterase [Ruminococcaceae bacterium]|nr:bifunctional diguanylate cyclase/phosphodiesterase [Oscillospiraceae bacterium]